MEHLQPTRLVGWLCNPVYSVSTCTPASLTHTPVIHLTSSAESGAEIGLASSVIPTRLGGGGGAGGNMKQRKLKDYTIWPYLAVCVYVCLCESTLICKCVQYLDACLTFHSQAIGSCPFMPAVINSWDAALAASLATKGVAAMLLPSAPAMQEKLKGRPFFICLFVFLFIFYLEKCGWHYHHLHEIRTEAGRGQGERRTLPWKRVNRRTRNNKTSPHIVKQIK